MPRAVQLPVQSKGTFHGQGNLSAFLVLKHVAFTCCSLLALSDQQRGWLRHIRRPMATNMPSNPLKKRHVTKQQALSQSHAEF